MIGNKSIRRLATVSLAVLSLGIAASPRFDAPANAQGFNPPDRGAPPRTADGGTRGCGYQVGGVKGLTALTPASSLALTVSDSPTFLWYVPQSNAQKLEFKMVEAGKEENVIYQTSMPTPSKAGIISVSLPAGAATSIQEGKMYHWYFSMVCDASDPTGNTVVDGWVERTQPSQALIDELKKATSRRELPAIYAKAGIWHEALATLVELRRNYPEDQTIASQWQEFLTSVQLGEFYNEPLVARTNTQE